jgi:hypothetical protein
MAFQIEALTPMPRRFPAARAGLWAFICLLPVHMLVMAMLFGLFRVDESTVRAIAAWKELTVLALTALCIWRAIIGLGSSNKVGWEDLAVGWLFALCLLFIVTENIWFRAGIPLGAELYGFRDLVFFMLLYFVGRATVDVIRDDRFLKALFVVAVLTSMVAILERIFVTPDMLVLLGAASYFQQFLGEAAFTAGNEFGLPQAYWTQINGVYVRRAGSVYLVSQAFAISFLLLMPAATAWVWGRMKRPSPFAVGAYVVVWIGFLLSLTRMTIVACAVQVLAYALLRKRAISAVSAIGMLSVVFVGASTLMPQIPGFVWQTLTWQTASSESHLEAWWTGIVAFAERPWGSGLGTTDASAVRFGLVPLTGDNQYLKYAVELGLPGFFLHLAIFAALAIAGFRVFSSSDSETERAFGAVVFLATLGILLNAWTATVFNSTVLAYLYFWLGGAVVTASHRSRST